MSAHLLVAGWSTDGSIGLAFAVIAAGAGLLYELGAAVGHRRDRRHRRWPWRRRACLWAGLVVLVVDLYSGIGGEADSRLAVHMLEHMLMWLVVAPLLVASAPVRLALFALRRDGRRRLGAALRSRPVAILTSPAGSVGCFTAVLLISHVPAVYALTLSHDGAHVTEHALYLITSMLVWAPLIGADPLPHRPGLRAQTACMLACMVPMAAVALWLLTASHPVYAHYGEVLGAGALADQRLAGALMLVAGVPAFAVAPLARARAAVRTSGPLLSSERWLRPRPTVR
jgi:cytochrome c oxidase assembly factor CtaG